MRRPSPSRRLTLQVRPPTINVETTTPTVASKPTLSFSLSELLHVDVQGACEQQKREHAVEQEFSKAQTFEQPLGRAPNRDAERAGCDDASDIKSAISMTPTVVGRRTKRWFR